MKIQTIGLGLSVIIVSFNVALGQSFDDILREVSVTRGNACSIGSPNCGSCPSQTCGLNCRGRIRYPTMHVLSSTSYHFSYCVQPKSLPSFPPSAESTMASRKFTFKTNRTCHQQLKVNNAASVSFWITGSCSPACEFMTVSGTSTQEYKWSLDDKGLKVNNVLISTLTVQQWTHIVFRVSGTTYGIFVDGASQTVSSISPIPVSIDMIEFGPNQGFKTGDSVSFLDVRVYEDFLTDSEIKSLYNNKVQPEDPYCRCPISHPKLSSNIVDTCESESGTQTQTQYQGSGTTFYDIKAVFDNNSTSVWAASSDVMLQLKLYDFHKAIEVNIAYEGTQPTKASANTQPCTFNTGNITCTVAESINMITLELSAPSSGNMMISDISVSGECNCDGNGMCTRSENYQTYTCDCSGNKAGDKCKACLPGYSLASSCTQCTANKITGSRCLECQENYYAEFAECAACNCTENSSEGCDKTTGECICKPGVTGQYCTQCQDKYYGFDLKSDPVCKDCNCHRFGAKNLTCNASGVCYCKDEFTDNQCTPRGTMFPLYGPISGGTIISINGTNFGLTPTVKLGGNTQNLNVSNNGNRIQFNATPGTSGEFNVVVSWNNNEESITINSKYTYKPDPSVGAEQNNTNIRTIKGCTMKYKGNNFNSVSQPRLEFKTNSNNYFQDCKNSSDKEIECIVPQLEENVAIETYLHLDCPNCGVYQNVTIESDLKVNENLDIDFTYPFTKTITITGKQFGFCKEDIQVKIGDTNCEIEDITNTEITCKPPEESPMKDTIEIDIMVYLGEKPFPAGKITYRDLLQSSYFVYIMVGVVAFVLIAIAIFIVICCRRKKHRNRDVAMHISAPGVQSTPNSYTEMQKANIDIIRPPTGVQNSAFNSDSFEETKKEFLQKLPHGLRPEVGSCIVNENEFSFGKVCSAKGDKARIIDGKLTKGNSTSQIMIKSIKKPFQDHEEYPEWVFKALTECVRFRNLSHTNVLSIIGIGLEQRKFHILYPYMKNRSLKYFVSDEKKEFSLKQLLGYGIQITEGMCFLNDHNIVHEDLATRNCMVNQDSLIKISDSAYSHDFYPTEYMFNETKNRYLPIRWMAPESIKFGFYDTKSDVWSYGVLLWELLTRGCLPFIDTADSGVYDLIAQGYRLGKPEIISDEIYELINKCWEEESDFRPSLTIIRDTLSNLMVGDVVGQDDLYINWTEPRQSIYINSESFKRKSQKNHSEPYYGNL